MPIVAVLAKNYARVGHQGQASSFGGYRSWPGIQEQGGSKSLSGQPSETAACPLREVLEKIWAKIKANALTAKEQAKNRGLVLSLKSGRGYIPVFPGVNQIVQR